MSVSTVFADQVEDLDDLNLDELEVQAPSGDGDYGIVGLCCDGSCFCNESTCYCCCCG